MREQVGREVVIVEAARTPIGRGKRETGYSPRACERAAGRMLRRGHRARWDRAGARRGRGRRVRDTGGRAVAEHRAQRVAAGGSAGDDAGDDGGPPVRLGPAGGELRSAQIAAASEVVIGAGVEHIERADGRRHGAREETACRSRRS